MLLLAAKAPEKPAGGLGALTGVFTSQVVLAAGGAAMAVVQGEHDENEVRKAFTPSERVAILSAISPPNGGDRVSEQRQNFVFDKHEAASKAGFGNYETARQARAVVQSGTPALSKQWTRAA